MDSSICNFHLSMFTHYLAKMLVEKCLLLFLNISYQTCYMDFSLFKIRFTYYKVKKKLVAETQNALFFPFVFVLLFIKKANKSIKSKTKLVNLQRTNN